MRRPPAGGKPDPQPGTQPTLHDVARRCGLSTSTVSHILGGARAHRFKPATRLRVSRAAEALGYRVSTAARAMRRGRTGTVALLLSSLLHRSQLPITQIAALERGLAVRSLALRVAVLPEERNTAEQLPAVLAEMGCEAFVVAYSSHIPAHLTAAIRAHPSPSVWLNCRLACDCVHPDELTNGQLAAEALVAAGCKRLVYLDVAHDVLGDVGHFSERDRWLGFQAGAARAGIAAQLEILATDSPAACDVAGLLDAGDMPGIATYSLELAHILAWGALRRGLEPGRTFQLASFEHRLPRPPTLPVHLIELADEALIEALLGMLDAKLSDPPTELPPIAVPGRLRPSA